MIPVDESWRGVVEMYFLDDDGDCRTEIQVIDPCHLRDQGWWATYRVNTCGHTDIDDHMIAGTGAMNVLMTCLLRASACRVWWLSHSVASCIQESTEGALHIEKNLHTKMDEFTNKNNIYNYLNNLMLSYTPIQSQPTYSQDLFSFAKFCTKPTVPEEEQGSHRYVDYDLSDDHVPSPHVPQPPSLRFISYLAFPPREIGNKATISLDLPSRSVVSFDNGSITVPCHTMQSLPNPLPKLCEITYDSIGPLAGKVLVATPQKGGQRIY